MRSKLAEVVMMAGAMGMNNLMLGMDRNRVPIIKDKEPGRNDVCPCGSGKKYKNCCMKNK
jgi:uncharacterized protein YecA (UPF0149 family)